VYSQEYLSNAEITRRIHLLSCSFGGIKPPCRISDMRSFFDDQLYSKCVLCIKKIFELPMTLRIGFLKDIIAEDIFGNQSSLGFDFFSPKLLSDQLLRSCHSDLSKEPAFLHFPKYMPFLHSQSFESITITMFLRGWLRKAPFETFVYVVSHQMAHIVLHATHHRLRHSEMATDLLAMIFGFLDIARIGRENHPHSLGYLDDYQFLIAYEKIKKLHSKNR
jgi:hypothetical protein